MLCSDYIIPSKKAKAYIVCKLYTTQLQGGSLPLNYSILYTTGLPFVTTIFQQMAEKYFEGAAASCNLHKSPYCPGAGLSPSLSSNLQFLSCPPCPSLPSRQHPLKVSDEDSFIFPPLLSCGHLHGVLLPSVLAEEMCLLSSQGRPPPSLPPSQE